MSLIPRLAKATPAECVSAYRKWITDVPDDSERTDWLVAQLESTQEEALTGSRPVSLPQIERVVHKVANQFSTLASLSYKTSTDLNTDLHILG